MKIVLLGAPGAGKDTLADKFKEQYNFTVLTTGEIFRQEAALGTELGLHARDTYWGKGILCPDDIVNRLMKEAYSRLSDKDKRNLIFNGYPRSVGQAEYLGNILEVDVALELGVTEAIAVERLIKRGREDDKENVIRRRFSEYEIKTEPVLDYYRRLTGCPYIYVDADEDAQVVFEEAFHMILENAPVL